MRVRGRAARRGSLTVTASLVAIDRERLAAWQLQTLPAPQLGIRTRTRTATLHRRADVRRPLARQVTIQGSTTPAEQSTPRRPRASASLPRTIHRTTTRAQGAHHLPAEGFWACPVWHERGAQAGMLAMAAAIPFLQRQRRLRLRIPPEAIAADRHLGECSGGTATDKVGPIRMPRIQIICNLASRYRRTLLHLRPLLLPPQHQGQGQRRQWPHKATMPLMATVPEAAAALASLPRHRHCQLQQIQQARRLRRLALRLQSTLLLLRLNSRQWRRQGRIPRFKPVSTAFAWSRTSKLRVPCTLSPLRGTCERAQWPSRLADSPIAIHRQPHRR